MYIIITGILFLNIYLIIIKNIKSKSQHYNEKLPEYSNTKIIITAIFKKSIVFSNKNIAFFFTEIKN